MEKKKQPLACYHKFCVPTQKLIDNVQRSFLKFKGLCSIIEVTFWSSVFWSGRSRRNEDSFTSKKEDKKKIQYVNSII